MMMRIAILLALATATTAQAQDQTLPHPIAAVGVLTYGGEGGCTGTLIRNDLVLTAAHCLGQRLDAIDPAAVTFRTGAYPGTVAVTRVGAEAVVHPLYDGETTSFDRRVSYDIGLLRLAEPVPPEAATPLVLSGDPTTAERIILASWRGGVGQRARERTCAVISAEERRLSIGCDVRGGESGAPLLARTPQGLAIVGVLTNRDEGDVQPIGHAAGVARVGQLIALLLPRP